MNTAVLFSSFSLIFLAELGDKTQITAMALATRHPWKRVFLGLAAAFLILNLGAVAVGKLLFTYVPPLWVNLSSGALFTYFGVKTLFFSEAEEEDDTPEGKAGNPVFIAFSMILLAELGDKTQIATATAAAQQSSPVEVFIGSTLALWSVSLLGILLGTQITKVLPMSWVHRCAGALFLAFGALAFYKATL